MNNYGPNTSVEAIFMNMENSKRYEPINLLLICHNNQTGEPQVKMLLFKTYLFKTNLLHEEKYKKTVWKQ